MSREKGSKITVPYSGVGSIIGKEEIEAVRKALAQDSLCWGEFVDGFEETFAKYVGAPYAMAVNNGTNALELATAALALKEGDEVITTPITFIATVLPLLKRKIKIVFADIDPNTLNIDPGEVARLVTPKTRAIYVVHYAGLPVDMDPIMDIAREHGLKVVVDAAHAPGAEYKGRKVGGIGDLTCFSFQSLKNMTTLGDGGMVTSTCEELAKRVRTLREFSICKPAGATTIYGHREEEPPFHWDVRDVDGEVGLNYRMAQPAAAMGLVQLGKLDEMNARRIEIGHRMNKAFDKIPGLKVIQEPEDYKHVYHLYTLLVDEKVVGSKDKFMERMDKVEGVELWAQYCPLHLFTIFRKLGYNSGLCPRAEEIFLKNLVNLPIFPGLTEEQIEHMIGAVARTVDDLK